MKVLITGANGFVGWHLSSYLEKRGFIVIRTDIKSADLIGDLLDDDFVFSKLKNLDFDAIVHLAAITDIKSTIDDPYKCYKINSFLTLNMLELANRKKCDRFVYSSSANVYGLPLDLPVKETTPFNPRLPYDYSKVIGEHLINSYSKHKGLLTTILRSWKLFGERDSPKAAIPHFIKSCLEDEPIPLYNSGRDTTDPYYVENYCHAVEFCLKKDEAINEVFNVGTGNELSIREVAEIIKSITKSNSKLQLLPPRSPLEAEPMRSYPSIEKIKRKLGYKPLVSFEEGLRRTIEWIRKVS
ncbi:MAG: GDP-mannose 4,6-dehydratase [archaeon]|nr:GDP-mannose 4,6-dehydratase [archaeon]MCP8315092.1 GDP-mannose 4,6-dehydratase [archaeon]MCP8317853.1 GDP-mannose 4,6-dehydratase [archaeon]MCP8319397.1 GDP-mannose 4,6-dehydratase [archaeon]